MTTPAMCARSLLVSLAAAGVFAANGSIEQTTPGKRPPGPIVASCDGLGGRNPSDNTLAVGPRHVFQIVNSQMAVYTKTGERVYGPLATNTMFAGFGGMCEARSNGDAVVRYDQLAGRWLVVMPIFRRTIFPEDRSAPGAPARPGDAARPGTGRPGPPPPPPPPPPRGTAGPAAAARMDVRSLLRRQHGARPARHVSSLCVRASAVSRLSASRGMARRLLRGDEHGRRCHPEARLHRRAREDARRR